MSDFDELTLKQVLDLGNKVGGRERAKRFMSGELVLVDKNQQISPDGSSNGGITYAFGLDTAAFLADWTRFYQDVFGLTVDDLSQVPLPPCRSGFHWGVAVLKGLTKQQVFDKGGERGLFLSWKYTDKDLDEAVPKDKDLRTADNGTYIIWCRDRVEADEEHKNLSANEIKAQGINPMTLLERLLLGLWFYWKTGLPDGEAGKHLDTKNITLCAGSRCSDGCVPRVYLHDDNYVSVDWYYLNFAYDDVRAREVVSV